MNNRLFLQRALKQVIRNPKTTVSAKLHATHLLGFLQGIFPAKLTNAVTNTTVSIPTPPSDEVQDLSSLLSEFDGKDA